MITKHLKLSNPNTYIRHLLYVTVATIIVDARMSLTNIKYFGGWKSDSTCKNYIQDSKYLKMDNAALVSSTTPPIIFNTTTTTTSIIAIISITVNTNFNLSNCNITINVIFIINKYTDLVKRCIEKIRLILGE